MRLLNKYTQVCMTTRGNESIRAIIILLEILMRGVSPVAVVVRSSIKMIVSWNFKLQLLAKRFPVLGYSCTYLLMLFELTVEA